MLELGTASRLKSAVPRYFTISLLHTIQYHVKGGRLGYEMLYSVLVKLRGKYE